MFIYSHYTGIKLNTNEEIKMNYPYRECGCGNQIHVGGTRLCDSCIEMTYKPVDAQNKPCKRCGANPIIIDMQGDINRVYVVCSKGCREDIYAAIEKWEK